MDQIIKFGISNYLQLCVEAGFSQIQSHIGYVLALDASMPAACIANLTIVHVQYILYFCVHAVKLINNNDN